MKPKTQLTTARLSRRTRPPQAFSLVELLVVMTVVSIMTIVMMPLLSSSRNAAQLTHAGNILLNQARQTRQVALTQAQMTGLVIARSANDSSSLAAAAFVLDHDGTWRPISKWISLPESVMIEPTEDQPETASVLNDLADSAISLRQGSQTVAIDDSYAVVFLPQGGTLQTSSLCRLRLVSRRTANTADNFYELVIRRESGDVLVLRHGNS